MSLALCLKQQRTAWSELGSLRKPWRGLIADWPGFCTAPIKVICSPGSYPAKPHHTAVHHIIMLFLNILIRYVLFMDSNSEQMDKDWGYRSQMPRNDLNKVFKYLHKANIFLFCPLIQNQMLPSFFYTVFSPFVNTNALVSYVTL